jgi:hypothetical protein
MPPRSAFRHPVDSNAIRLDSPLPDGMQRFCAAQFGDFTR